MKNLITLILLSLSLFSNSNVRAQADRDSTEQKVKRIYVITTNNGGEFVGLILKQDAREILIKTQDRGEVVIPKYEIREMKELKGGEMSAGGIYIPEEVFATRYFLTTNALPIEKSESYVLWNAYGPEIHFGVAKNFSLGLMTTWVGIPVIGSAKYSIPLGENLGVGVGLLAGTGSWAAPGYFGGLPYGAITIGNRRSNINISGGYGFISHTDDIYNAYGGYSTRRITKGTTLLSLAGMTKISKRASFVLDSFFFVQDNYTSNSGVLGVIIPGIRVQGKHDAAFQFGFSGAYGNGEIVPMPIPMLGWFKKL